MKPDRLCAFTDGVFAIIITIMVLELHVPDGTGLDALRPEVPLFGAYVFSFVYIGIYWNNHHHMMQWVRRINGAVLWANLFLLFWLSLFPFLIRWIGERGLTSAPAAAFGIVLFMAGLAYSLLERVLASAEGADSSVAKAVGAGVKEWTSVLFYGLGIIAAFLVSPYVSVALYGSVAIMWLIPDRRFERPA
jgi:uncharacterized membrane protein